MTSDFHSLREWRGKKLLDENPLSGSMPSSPSTVQLDLTPDASDLSLQRELASIHRSDLTLVCSSVELKLLKDVYGVASDKLVLAPFFVTHDRCVPF